MSLSVPNNQLPASGATPVVVTVRDHLGSPLAGQVVSLLGPDGSVFADTTGMTDGAGRFSTTIDLGTPWATPGKTVTLTALSGGTSASASATILGSNLLVGLSQTPRVFPSPVVDYSPLWGLAVLADGSVWKNDPNWVVMPEITNAARLATSNSVHVLKKDGTVVGWGVNDNGQLGDGTTTDRTSPVVFQGLSDVTQIRTTLGGLHALKSDGTLWYQGRNTGGRAGVGSTMTPVPLTQVPLSARAVQVVNWVGFTAGVVLEDGTVWTWGRNDEGQLADGTTTQQNSPVKVLGLSGITALAGSNTFQDYNGANYLALKNDGTVWSWGRNEYGQLGRNGTTNSFVPTQLAGVDNVTQIAMTPSGSYALKSDGTFLAWGRTGFSGVGTVPTPTVVSVSRPISELLGSETYDGCPLTTAETTTTVDVVETTLTAGVAGTVNAKVAAGSVGLSGAAVSLSSTSGAILGAASGTTGPNGVFSTSVTAPQWSTPGTQVRISATSGDGSASETAPVLGSNLVAWMLQTPRVFPSPVVDYSLLWGLAVLADGSVWQADGPNWVVKPEITNAARVSGSQTGPNSVFILKKDGTIVGWGTNGDGQLGDGTTTDRTSPVVFQGLDNVTQIQAGQYGLHALKSDGTVWYQGRNLEGRGGVGLTTSPVPLTQVVLPARAVQVVNWVGYTAGAVLEDGTVWTWGRNNEGQLADGTTTQQNTPVKVLGLSGITALAGSATYVDYGGANYLALKNDGTVWSWGRNEYGQLGRNGTTASYLAAKVPGLSNVAQIATSPSGSYALQNDGTFLTWGLTGAGGNVARSTPTARPAPRPIAKLLGTHGHSYNIQDCPFITAETTTTLDVVETNLTAGVAGTVNAKVAAGSVGFVGAAVSLSAVGGDLGAASGTTGQDGVFSTSVTAPQWSTPGAQVRISATSGDGSASETVSVLGSNLLVGLVQTPRVFPSPVVDYHPLWQIAVLADGSVWHNGPNWVLMPEITNAARVSGSQAGPNSVFILKKDGTIVGWGTNGDGQLGDGTTTDQTSPVAFQGLDNVTQIQAGQYGLHALKSDGTLWFQGRNTEGRGGVGLFTSPVPLTQVVLPARAVQVVNWVGYTAAAVLEDGTVWTWGRNNEGQLADGTTTQQNTPVKALGLSGITALAGAATFEDYNGANYLALKNDGTVWSWGRNAAGQLGRNGTTNSFAPAQVPGLSDVTQIATSPSASYALRSDGTFLAWGRTGFSSIGTVSTPTVVTVSHSIVTLIGVHGHSWGDGCALVLGPMWTGG
ncbi:hypothetical protein IFU40_06455 [Microbacterium sp. CFBP 13617]|nr:hypothetical protein [Microbacterium sp. CFBP 13617]